MTTSVKRDRKKVHALNFIEDTNKSDKKDSSTLMDEEEVQQEDATKDKNMEEEREE